jgi:hypothetical protein
MTERFEQLHRTCELFRKLRGTYVARTAKHMLRKMRVHRLALATAAAIVALAFELAAATLGGALPAPLPLFPVDNWWNLDVSTAPVDSASNAYITFINNGGTRRLHPDFGGEASPGSVSIYGFPYVVVDGTQAKRAVQFQYSDESDGVTTPPIRAFPSTRSLMKRSRRRTGLKAASPATSIGAHRPIAIC